MTKTYSIWIKDEAIPKYRTLFPYEHARKSYIQGAFSALKSVSGLKYTMQIRCDQTNEVIDTAEPSNMTVPKMPIPFWEAKKKYEKRKLINALAHDLQEFDILYCEDNYNNDYTFEKGDLEIIIEALKLLEEKENE